MKMVSFFVFLTFALVLSHQDVDKKMLSAKEHVTIDSTYKALQFLMQEKKPVLFAVSDGCRSEMSDGKFEYTVDVGLLYKFGKSTCYATGTESNKENKVSLYSITGELLPVPDGSDQCSNNADLQAVFLRFQENDNTYTVLNQEVPWFFTDELGGCDMFVAAAKNRGFSPLVVHSNRNSIENQALNLQAKGDSVNKLIAMSYPGYKVIARVFSYNRLDASEEEKKAVSNYVTAYSKNHPGIQLFPYDNFAVHAYGKKKIQKYSFIGRFVSLQQPQYWRFILKGNVVGDAVEFRVSKKGEVLLKLSQNLNKN